MGQRSGEDNVGFQAHHAAAFSLPAYNRPLVSETEDSQFPGQGSAPGAP